MKMIKSIIDTSAHALNDFNNITSLKIPNYKFNEIWLSPSLFLLRMSKNINLSFWNLRATGYQAISSQTDGLPQGYSKAT